VEGVIGCEGTIGNEDICTCGSRIHRVWESISAAYFFQAVGVARACKLGTTRTRIRRASSHFFPIETQDFVSTRVVERIGDTDCASRREWQLERFAGRV
jgi:hypothetical protein